MIEKTFNSLKGGYVLLFATAAVISAMWAVMSMIYAMFGLTGLVVICIPLSSVLFIYCLKTYNGFDISKFLNQKAQINNLNKNINKMLAHENDQGQLISDMMKVLSMDSNMIWDDQLADARKVAARMKARIVAVKKV